jgi:uncharacterized protein
MNGNTQNPYVWLLLGRKGGDNAQLRNLAGLMGWPYAEKQLYFNRLSSRPNIFLGPTLLSLKKGSAALAPPWPDLLISAGRRSVPAARWVKKHSQGRTKLIHLGRPWGPLNWFDLIITTPQYRLPSRPNVIDNTFPVIWRDPHQSQKEGEIWLNRFSALPRPWICLLSGGTIRPFIFDVQTAKLLGRLASSFAREHGGSLLITASRRCSPASFQALVNDVDCPCHIHDPHTQSQENPYGAYLNLADMFIVTCDSVSMIAEACLTQKPVLVFDLPIKYDRKMFTAAFIKSFLQKGKYFPSCLRTGRIYELLVEYGLLTSTRDVQHYNDILRQKGLIIRFGEKNNLHVPKFSNREELELTLSRVKGILK